MAARRNQTPEAQLRAELRVEKAHQRRRRYYRLTAAGAAVLEGQRKSWLDFVAAINRVTRPRNA